MTTRILDPVEWPRLPEAALREVLGRLPAADAQVVVAEDGDRIVGAWAVLKVVHLEGVWIDPAYRKRGTVAGRLLHATLRAAREWGTWAMTGAQTDDVRRLIEKHLHGTKVQMDTYVVPTCL